MTFEDARDVAKTFGLALMAWLVPPRFWRKAAAATWSVGKPDPGRAAYRYILGDKYSESEIAAISTRRRIYLRELRLQLLGMNGPWYFWRPRIRLHGAAHLQKALADGHGAILWVTETPFSTLIVKMALHQAGYHAVQLSRPGHGFSFSPFGIRYLNPFWRRVEDRFIAERVLILGETATDALATLRARIAENAIVIITVVPQAHKFVHVPFFDTKIRLPTGPMRLARDTGAVMLPVFTVPQDDGSFDVTLGEALAAPQAGDETVAAAYAKRLEPFVTEHPDQWNGWNWIIVPESR